MPREKSGVDTAIRELSERGLKLSEMADLLGMSVGSIVKVRQRLGLGRKRARVDLDALRALHQQGLSDYEIAWRLGFHQVSILYARRRIGLPPNSKPMFRQTQATFDRLELFEGHGGGDV